MVGHSPISFLCIYVTAYQYRRRRERASAIGYVIAFSPCIAVLLRVMHKLTYQIAAIAMTYAVCCSVCLYDSCYAYVHTRSPSLRCMHWRHVDCVLRLRFHLHGTFPCSVRCYVACCILHVTCHYVCGVLYAIRFSCVHAHATMPACVGVHEHMRITIRRNSDGIKMLALFLQYFRLIVRSAT